MKRWPLGFLLVIAISAHAQSFWDGNAAVQRGDAAFDAGAFALSSAFARDTEIVVEDPATGKTTTAKVVGRVEDRLDILVLLSPAAAGPIGLEVGEVVHVRVTIRKALAANAPIVTDETTASTDPDSILAPEESAAAISETAGEAAQAVTTGTPATAAETAESAKESIPAGSVTPAAEEPAEETVAEESAEKPSGEAPSADELLLAELAARTPQKQLHLPPREDEMFVYQEPVEPPPVEVAEAPTETVAQAPTETVAQAPTGTVAQAPTGTVAQAPTGTVAEAPTETVAETRPETVDVPPLTGSTTTSEPGVESLELAALAEPEIASDPGPDAPGRAGEPIALVEASPPAEIRPELVETLIAEAPAALPPEKTVLAEPGLASETAGQPAVAAEAPVEKPPAETPPATDGKTATAETTATGTTETTAATGTTATTATQPAAEEKPPVTTTATQPAAEEKPPVAPAATQPAAAKPVAVVLDLPAKGSLTYYLQLAAYSTEAMAKDTAARLSSTYPVLVLAPPAGSKPLYRVFIGPLNRAESGTLLVQFRQRGFPDAFARTAQN